MVLYSAQEKIRVQTAWLEVAHVFTYPDADVGGKDRWGRTSGRSQNTAISTILVLPQGITSSLKTLGVC